MKTAEGTFKKMLAGPWVCVLAVGVLCVAQTQTGAVNLANGTTVAMNTPGADAAASPTAAPMKPHDDSFIIGIDDVLAINVWKEPDVSRAVPVRSDGKISLPLAGEVQASGETPKTLERAIAAKLQSYIAEPEVTVIVQEIRSRRFNILGQVEKPGAYPLANSATILDAIALAGGFRDFAKQKSIYVLRQNPNGTQSRIPFNYKQVIRGKNPEENIFLQPRDTVVVP